MKKKSLAIVLMLSAAFGMVACSEDTPNEPIPEEIPVVMNYKMTCVQNICSINIREGSTGGAVISLTVDDAYQSPVQGATVNVTSTGSGFTLVNGPTLTTNASGRAAVSIKADAPGSGLITFTAPEFNVSTTFTVVIEAVPETKTDPEPEPIVLKDVQYDINVSYAGEKEISMVEVGIFAGRTCAQIAPANLEVKNVASIPMPADPYYLGIKRLVSGSALFNYTVKENDPNIFAVLAKDTAAQAYGCTDGLSLAKKSVTVTLNDSKPNVDIVEPGEIDYSGTYDLTSSFDALSLLPNHCGTVSEDDNCDPSAVWFKDMLFGDWLKLSLNLLDNPGKTISDILSKQLIPHLTDSEKMQELLDKIGMGAIAPTLSAILPSLIDTLHLDTILDDFILQLTKNVAWWDTAESIVTIVNNLAQQFTLKGDFIIAAEVLDENGEIGNITHEYNSILYNNGKFQNCVLGSNYGVDGQGNLICKIDISSVSDQKTIKGKFRAKFTEGVNPVVNVYAHALGLAYGELIYKTLMQFVPLITQTSDGVVKKSLGGILEYYIGYGLVAFWNNKKANSTASDPAYISSSEFIGCSAIEEVIRKAILGTDEDPSGFVQVLNALLIPNVHTLCDAGIVALDRVIENTLGYHLSVSEEKMNDVVTFTSKNCRFYPNEEHSKIISIGKVTPIDDLTWWNSKATDDRCNWSISVKFSDAKTTRASGKFYAVGMK